MLKRNKLFTNPIHYAEMYGFVVFRKTKNKNSTVGRAVFERQQLDQYVVVRITVAM
jgi:hypothetical protein